MNILQSYFEDGLVLIFKNNDINEMNLTVCVINIVVFEIIKTKPSSKYDCFRRWTLVAILTSTLFFFSKMQCQETVVTLCDGGVFVKTISGRNVSTVRTSSVRNISKRKNEFSKKCQYRMNEFSKKYQCRKSEFSKENQCRKNEFSKHISAGRTTSSVRNISTVTKNSVRNIITGRRQVQ